MNEWKEAQNMKERVRSTMQVMQREDEATVFCFEADDWSDCRSGYSAGSDEIFGIYGKRVCPNGVWRS